MASLDVSQVATRLGVCSTTVRRLIESGRLRAYHGGAGARRNHWRVDAAHLADYIAENRDRYPEAARPSTPEDGLESSIRRRER